MGIGSPPFCQPLKRYSRYIWYLYTARFNAPHGHFFCHPLKELHIYIYVFAYTYIYIEMCSYLWWTFIFYLFQRLNTPNKSSKKAKNWTYSVTTPKLGFGKQLVYLQFCMDLQQLWTPPQLLTFFSASLLFKTRLAQISTWKLGIISDFR